jgi:hypothetical protein
MPGRILYHALTAQLLRAPLLLIVNLASKAGTFPIQTLDDIDAALANVGFKKEIRSVVVPGKQFSVTYDGPTTEKNQIEKLLQPIAAQNQISFSLDVDESVKFP